MGVKPITSLEEYKQIINSGKPVLIDFWAEWCGPCKVISPVFEALSNTSEGVEFYKVDIDKQSDIAELVGIKAMPTFKLFKDGINQEGDEVVGVQPQQLKDLVGKGASLI